MTDNPKRLSTSLRAVSDIQSLMNKRYHDERQLTDRLTGIVNTVAADTYRQAVDDMLALLMEHKETMINSAGLAASLRALKLADGLMAGERQAKFTETTELASEPRRNSAGRIVGE